VALLGPSYPNMCGTGGIMINGHPVANFIVQQPPPPSPPSQDPSPDSHTGLYIGLGVAGGVLLACAAIAFYYFRVYKPAQDLQAQHAPLLNY